MKALIFAEHGTAKGLNKSKPGSLTKLLGLSLIERVVLSAKHADITEFLMVTDSEEVKRKLGDGSKYGVEIKYLTISKVKKVLKDDFVILSSSYIFDHRILKQLINHQTGASVLVAVDKTKLSAGDIKILEKNGKVIDIGADIKRSNCVYAGMLRCSPKVFNYMKSLDGKSANAGIMELVTNAAERKDAEIFDINWIETYDSKMRKDIEPWWIYISREDDLATAEQIIIENASKNPSDALACYVHKPIENKLVAFISKYNITPNQITIIVNILAYTATALFFYGYLLIASLITFVVGVVDGLDGKLARVKLKTSKLGSLEHSFDLLFEFSWIIALSCFLFISTRDATPLILCILIITFVSFYRNVYDRFRSATGVSLDDYGGFERKFKRIAGRRNLYNIPILVSILLNVPLYSLFFILFHSAVTAIVYTARAAKHMYDMDRGIVWQR